MNTSNVQKTSVDIFLIGLIALLLLFGYYNNQGHHKIKEKVKSIVEVVKR